MLQNPYVQPWTRGKLLHMSLRNIVNCECSHSGSSQLLKRLLYLCISNVSPTVGQRSAYRETTLWVGSSGIRARYMKEDFIFQNVQIGSGLNAASYSICTGVLPRGREAGA
jgi:hypothetical protein